MHYEPPGQPAPPAAVAHRANDLATAAADARQSREALEAQIRQELRHPVHQKLIEAMQGRRLLVYSLLALAFPFIVYWEWAVSREIYAIWFPDKAWIPFAGCVAVALYFSACLAESSSHFSVVSLSDMPRGMEEHATGRALERLYDQPPKGWAPTAWMLHPITGIVGASLFLWGIYLASQMRVDLLREAGEDPGAAFNVYLPVVLYAVEIVLGVPTVFLAWVLTCIYTTRRRRGALAQAKRDEDTLRHTAIQQYSAYLSAFTEYNTWAQQHGRPQAFLLPCGANLRRLLTEEWGQDRTLGPLPGVPPSSPGPSNPSGGPGGPLPYEGGTPVGGPSAAAGATAQPGPQASGDASREADLLNLLDEQIAAQNRGIGPTDSPR